MGYISNKDGSYYEGDKQYGAIEVPQRPSPSHIWQDEWVIVPPTPEQLLKAIEQAIEKHMDEVAQSKRYDNRDSCRLYAGYTNPFRAEATAFGQWVSACWVASNQVQADIMNGLRTIPTPEEAVAELPIQPWYVAPVVEPVVTITPP
jgi:hypothetical protein